MYVDRQSGWMIARPCSKLGLTGERAAHLLLDYGWGEIGIPSLVMSDQGPQFLNQWWAVMCSRLGIRQAFSQSHRPQANGRAEVAGRVVQDLLRRLQVMQHINWFEALPRVLRIHHDMVDLPLGCPLTNFLVERGFSLGSHTVLSRSVLEPLIFSTIWNGLIKPWLRS